MLLLLSNSITSLPCPTLHPRSATVINGGKYRLHLFKTGTLRADGLLSPLARLARRAVRRFTRRCPL